MGGTQLGVSPLGALATPFFIDLINRKQTESFAAGLGPFLMPCEPKSHEGTQGHTSLKEEHAKTIYFLSCVISHSLQSASLLRLLTIIRKETVGLVPKS